MQEMMNIPKLIHVGCQTRSDTYTGQLAYIIYTDEKGKVRKQTSWEGWRDKSIDPQDFDNEPTEGFVLNRGVGGARQSWGWNTRNEYIRVYDPRGFEFEISVANMLFILQECNAIKGKGLEGEFVYAWSGTELVLLPVTCEEYKTSVEFTAAKSKKVTKADMIEGHVYTNKDMEELIYLGRHEHRAYFDRKSIVDGPSKKSHIFYHEESASFVFERGFTRLATKVGTECHPDYANLYTKFQESKYVSKFTGTTLTPISAKDFSYYSYLFFVKLDDGTLSLKRINDDYYKPRTKNNNYHNSYQLSDEVRNAVFIISENELTDPSNALSFDENVVLTEQRQYSYGYGTATYSNNMYGIWKGDPLLKSNELFTIQYVLESGIKLGVNGYVDRD